MSRSMVGTLLVAALVLAVWASRCHAQSYWGPCAVADSLVDTLDTWQELHRTFAVLRPCDDGVIGEGISDFVVHHLATHWNTFPELATLAQADTAFGSWVVGHIDATTDWDETALIVRHSRGRGPVRFVAFRRRVREAARSANAESHEAVESAKRH